MTKIMESEKCNHSQVFPTYRPDQAVYNLVSVNRLRCSVATDSVDKE